MSTSTIARLSLACPEGCVDTTSHRDFDDDLDDDGTGNRLHPGPTFGTVQTYLFSYGDGRPTVRDATVDVEGGVDAAGLRRLAADALAAAEWIEARG